MKLTLLSIHTETSQVSSFVFAPSEPVSFIPGQHISTMLKHEKPDERGTVRTFTISSSNAHTDTIAITTKKGPSTFKQALFALQPGQSLEARNPGGLFTVKTGVSKSHVFIAGGIGITPFISMIRSAADARLTEPMTLLYSNKTADEIAFHNELESLSHKVPLQIIHTITQPASPELQQGEPANGSSWQGRVGRIDEGLVQSSVPHADISVFYLCGPHLFVQAMTDLLVAQGIAKDSILFEKFSGY